MYGEYCVTKSFTNADDIRLRINLLLVQYIQRMACTTEKKNCCSLLLFIYYLSLTVYFNLGISCAIYFQLNFFNIAMIWQNVTTVWQLCNQIVTGGHQQTAVLVAHDCNSAIGGQEQSGCMWTVCHGSSSVTFIDGPGNIPPLFCAVGPNRPYTFNVCAV